MDFEESGEGAGGYAKEMSKEWHEAANKMLKEQCKEVGLVTWTWLEPVTSNSSHGSNPLLPPSCRLLLPPPSRLL